MSRIKNMSRTNQSRFARRRADRKVAEAALQEQRAWWATAWSQAAALARQTARLVPLRSEKLGDLERKLGVTGLRRVGGTARRPHLGKPEYVHQHAGHPYRPHRNPERAERLARSGRLRRDLEA